MSNYLTVLLDSPQDRLQADALSTLVSGKDWDPTTWGSDFGTWVDPVARRAMLEPAPINYQWVSQSSGIFTKWGNGDFTLLQSGTGSWSQDNVDGGGPFMLYTDDAGNASNWGGYTNFSIGLNQPICFEMFVPGSIPGGYGLVNVGVSSSLDGSAGVSLEIFGAGECNVWKNGTQVGHYSLSGDLFGYYDASQNSFGAAPKDWLRILIVPVSDRELLVVSPTYGGGFSHIFLDLLEGDAGQTILDDAPFWFAVQSPVYPIKVRAAPIQFAAAGTIAGYASGWRDNPGGGSPDTTYVYQSLTPPSLGTSVTLTAASSGFANPNGIPYPVQLQFSLSGGPSISPAVYGGIALYNAETASLDTGGDEGGGLDVTGYCLAGSYSVEDAIGGCKATITLRSPAAIAEAGSPNLTTMNDRAFELLDANGNSIGSFIAESPIWEQEECDGTDEGFDLMQEIELAGRDGWKFAEDFEFGDPLPLDTLTLTQALTAIAVDCIGFGSVNISSTADSVVIGDAGVSGDADWNYQIEVGGRGSEALKKLVETYAASWWMDLVWDGSQWVFTLLDPAEMDTTPIVTLYRSIGDAMSLGSYDAATAPFFVYRKIKIHNLEPEATQAWTVGEDFRTGRPIIVGSSDDAAGDPTIPLGSRSANWVGYVKKCSFGTDSLTTINDVSGANGLYFSRVSASRQILEWECEYLDGVSRGQFLTLDQAYGPGSGPVNVQIKTLSGAFEIVDGTNQVQWRPFRYVGENSSIVCPLGVGGTSVRQIKENWSLKQLSKSRMGEGMSISARRPPINVQSPS